MKIKELFESINKRDTLYCSRKLLNGAELLKWAEAQGFEKCLDPKDMHVTIAYSKKKIDWSNLTDSSDTVQCSDGDRAIKQFDGGAIVLTFKCDDLENRWKELIDDFGASWDYSDYSPHITITYDGLPDGIKLEDIEPYTGTLTFGPEIMEPVDGGWKGKIKETKLDDEEENPNPVDTPAFKNWFRNSKVVDANDNPVVVYHGTDKKFRAFSKKKSIMGIIWFTSNKADIEAGEVGAAGKGHVLEMYASIQNPAGWEEYDKLGLWELQARGYDGAMLKHKDGSFTGFVFNPTQLKSVKNKGTFDPSNKNLKEMVEQFLEPSDDNIASAKAFVLKKWKERAAERYSPEPTDLTSSCKFTSLFANKVFGGKIKGNWQHQFVQLPDGKIIDLNIEAEDVKRLGQQAHAHDESFWRKNPEHKESMISCVPRVNTWVKEFRSSLDEDFRINDIEDRDAFYDVFKRSYEDQTGMAWSEDKLFSRARNWTFFGDEKGFVAVRVQNSGLKKMVAVAGDPRSIIKGIVELQASGGPIWGAVSAPLASMAKKRGMIVPHLVLGGPFVIKVLAKVIPPSVFGGHEPKVTKDGGLVFDYEDIGTTTKYIVGNKEYFSSLFKMPDMQAALKHVPGIKQFMQLIGL